MTTRPRSPSLVPTAVAVSLIACLLALGLRHARIPGPRSDDLAAESSEGTTSAVPSASTAAVATRAAEARTPSHRPGTASVKGAVVAGSAGGASVPGARIRAIRLDGESAPREATADAAGRYELELAPGRWLLIARASRLRAAGAEVAVEAGVARSLEPLVLLRPLTVGGAVRGADGSAVAATVTLSGPDPRMLTTEADGSFAFSDVLSGRYTLVAQAAGFARRSLDGIAVSDRSVALPAIELAPACTVSGTVEDEAHQPVAGARVFVSRPDELLAEGTSDGRGGYRIDGVPAGAVNVLAAAPGLAGQRAAYVALGPGTRADVHVRRSHGVRGKVHGADGVLLASGRVVARSLETNQAWSGAIANGAFALDAPPWALVFSVEPGGSSFPLPATGALDAAEHEGRPARAELGLAAEGALAGTVLDAAGAPVNNARVDIFMKGTDASREVYAGADGSFTFAGLPAGDFQVTAKGWTDTAETWDGRFAEASVHVSPGETASAPLVLAAAVPAIAGRLVDARGAPIPAVELDVALGSGSSRFKLLVGDQGELSLGALAPGTHTFFMTRSALALAQTKVVEPPVVFTPVRVTVPHAGPIVLVADSPE